jgi:glycosyltransferase involved in cell wall biosynthesis
MVGVVVPMFNSERTISATLRSICEQTHRKLDIVVVDDGSTDQSAAAVGAWQARDRRVRLVHQANAGVTAARNNGAASTAAGFLAFVDADDLWAPTKVEYQLAALQEGGGAVGAAYCWFATIDETDRAVSFGPQPLAEGRILRELCAVRRGERPLRPHRPGLRLPGRADGRSGHRLAQQRSVAPAAHRSAGWLVDRGLRKRPAPHF